MARARAPRRGLPRVAGGQPWPPAGRLPVLRRGLPRVPGGPPWPVADPEAVVLTIDAPPLGATVSTSTAGVPTGGEPDASAGERVDLPALPVATTPAAVTASTGPAPASPAGPHRRARVFAAAAGLVLLSVVAVLVARALTGTTTGQQFLARYPGQQELPPDAPVGLPAWVGWQHFLNLFFMLLVVRTGLQVRFERRPPAYWTSRGGRRTSLTVWLHQALDVLWLANGATYVVLLFATGQWVRVVPRDWEVFPQALSAGLQYLSLDWPVENGWANYNALQVLAYFTTTFVAAPLAAITGFRMSTVWPERARRLSAAYPVTWARAVHVPVMVYFLGFVAVHVFLVAATGLLRNLNHVFAARDGVGWTGLLVLVGALATCAAGWVAARPTVAAAVASKFGTVGR